MSELHLEVTHGLVGGMTIQLAEGHWPGEIGPGVAMSDEAFAYIEPLVKLASAAWTSDHRYGVFELSLPDRKSLAKLLRGAAESSGAGNLFLGLADWIEARCGDDRPISILGY